MQRKMEVIKKSWFSLLWENVMEYLAGLCLITHFVCCDDDSLSF